MAQNNRCHLFDTWFNFCTKR